ncbi:MAG: hypothetical protein WC460_00415 [Patescibacteria group bacterium]
MSRNLGATACVHCEHPVELLEEPRPITEKEAGVYFDNKYKGMLVAEARCPICLAKYLAWIDDTNSILVRREPEKYSPRKADYGKVFDLSYLSTFDDEPGDDDLPIYDVEVITTWHRVAKIR